MRAERQQRTPRQGRTQVMKQHRSLAHREYPGLGARRVAQMGAIADGKQRRIGQALQVGGDRDKAALQRQPGCGQPGVRVRACHRHAQPRCDPAAIGQLYGTCLDAHRACICHQRHPAPHHMRQKCRAGAGAEPGQGLRPGLDHANLGICPGLGKPLGGGQRQFHPGNAAAQDRHRSGRLARLHPCQKSLPAFGERPHRFCPNAVFGKPRQVWQPRGDANVDRGHVKGHVRATRHRDPPLCPVDPRCRTEDQPRPGKAGQPDQIDFQRGARIVAGDMARQHAGIGCGRLGIDQGQPHTGQRRHAPAAQHQRMGMTAADQHEVAGQGQVCGKHRGSSAGQALAIRLRPQWRGGERANADAPDLVVFFLSDLACDTSGKGAPAVHPGLRRATLRDGPSEPRAPRGRSSLNCFHRTVFRALITPRQALKVPAQAVAPRFPNYCTKHNPPCLAACAFTQGTGQTSIKQLPDRSPGISIAWIFLAGVSKPEAATPQRVPLTAFCFLPDLAADKSGRACLPPAGAIVRPPRQSRPDFPATALNPTAVALRLAPAGKGPGICPPDSCLIGSGCGLMVRTFGAGLVEPEAAKSQRAPLTAFCFLPDLAADKSGHCPGDSACHRPAHRAGVLR